MPTNPRNFMKTAQGICACMMYVSFLGPHTPFLYRLGSVFWRDLLLLLFVIVREAISREFRVAVPWELLYADDLAVIAETGGAS